MGDDSIPVGLEGGVCIWNWVAEPMASGLVGVLVGSIPQLLVDVCVHGSCSWSGSVELAFVVW